jgi:hypothetical protein
MTHLIMNLGADIPEPGEGSGWTNTYEEACRIAWEWFVRMNDDGLAADVVLFEGQPFRPPVEGRWTFIFRHTVTGVDVKFETHGIAPMEAYLEQSFLRAHPRQYWNGSSSADPCLNDFAAPGFVQTYRRVTG